MSRAHYGAFQALLPAGTRAHRGYVSKKLVAADYPYVVLGGSGGDEATETLSGDVDSLEFRLKVTYSGLSFDAVLIQMEKVRRAFLSERLVIPGWSCGTVRHETALNVQVDFDVTLDGGLHPLFAVDEFTVFCSR